MTGPASHPDDPMLLIHAYVDGELDPANALDIERRIAADPALAGERERIDTLRQLLHDRLPRQAASPMLRARIEGVIGLRQPRRQPSWRALAASIAVTAMVASSSTYLAVRSQAPLPVPEQVFASHVRAMMAPQPADVSSSDRHTVKPWFNGRIPESPRVVDLTSQGFPLIGGRIDVIGRDPVPTLVYHHRQHLISLTAIPAANGGSTMPPPNAIDGYNLLRWTDGKTAYWAISDVEATELETFAQLFRTTTPE